MNGYELSRNFTNFAFDNPEKIKPTHYAIFFFAIEHCNRLGWKKKFGLPTTMTMEAIGIKSYNTYITCFNELVEWGFIELIEKSKNQHSSNIVALSNFNKAHTKALDNAFTKHATKQDESELQSTQQSIDSIDKPLTNNNKPITINKRIPTFEDFKEYALEKKPLIDLQELKLKYDSWVVNGWKDGNDKVINNWRSKLLNTLPYIKERTITKTRITL